jgi:3',5'-cyclic AMP phosphodiesterase CpdA
MVHFVHISDTHIGPTADYALHGAQTLPPLERVVARINALPVKPDFVIHTGDVAAQPDPAAYLLTGSAMDRLSAPVYYVTGNHDRSRDIRAFLRMGPRVDMIEGEEVLAYRFGLRGHRMIVLDARGPDSIDPHGLLPEAQLQILRREAEEGDLPLTVFLHFPPVTLGSPWLDEGMLLLNGEDLHRVLVSARDRLRGVFFGHVHRGMHALRDGVLYSSVGSTFCQFTVWPSDERPGFEAGGPAHFNFVTLTPDGCIVKEHIV